MKGWWHPAVPSSHLVSSQLPGHPLFSIPRPRSLYSFIPPQRFYPSYSFCFDFCLLFFFRAKGKKGGREEQVGKAGRDRSIDLLFHLFVLHWLILVCALTRDWTHNLGIWEDDTVGSWAIWPGPILPILKGLELEVSSPVTTFCWTLSLYLGGMKFSRSDLKSSKNMGLFCLGWAGSLE